MFRSLVSAALVATMILSPVAQAQQPSTGDLRIKAVEVVQELYDISIIKANITSARETLALLVNYEDKLSSKITKDKIAILVSVAFGAGMFYKAYKTEFMLFKLMIGSVGVLSAVGFGGSYGLEWARMAHRRGLTRERMEEVQLQLNGYKKALENDSRAMETALSQVVEMGKAQGLDIKAQTEAAIKSQDFHVSSLEGLAREISKLNFSSEIEGFKSKDAQRGMFWISVFAIDDTSDLIKDAADGSVSSTSVINLVVDAVALAIRWVKDRNAKETIKNNKATAEELTRKIASTKEAYRAGLLKAMDSIFAH
ncbi:MAG: hypothetical protein ABL958_18355 [Bdellovibrionia bacterium]